MAEVDVLDLSPLLQRVLAGDGAAFDELLGRLRPYLHYQVRRQLGAGDHGPIDQSALVQSALRRVVVHFKRLQAPTVPLLLGWIGAIVRNRVNDELRRIAREPAPLGSAVEFVRDPRPTAESQARADLAAEVASALARLPACERRVVETKWFDPRPDEETAQELGITVNYVRQLRFRALEKLRETLAPSAEASR